MKVIVLIAALLMPLIAWFNQRGVFGPDNGTISDAYPTLLVAAGYAFSIWGLIFLWDLAFGLWQLKRGSATVARIRPWAAGGFALTASWMPVFSMQIFWLSLVIIWAALGCLVFSALTLSRDREPAGVQFWAALVPLSIHAGWLSLAAFLNTAQVIVAYRLLPTRDMLPWSLVLFVAAAGLLLSLNARMRGNVPNALAALWGLAAVYVKQSNAPLPGASTAAWVAVGIAVILLVQTVWLRGLRRQHRS